MVYWLQKNQHRSRSTKQDENPSSTNTSNNHRLLFVRSVVLLAFLLLVSVLAIKLNSSQQLSRTDLNPKLTDEAESSGLNTTVNQPNDLNSGYNNSASSNSTNGSNTSTNSSTTNINVNGQKIDVPANGSVNEVIRNGNSQATVDASNTYTSNSNSSSNSNNSSLNININDKSGG